MNKSCFIKASLTAALAALTVAGHAHAESEVCPTVSKAREAYAESHKKTTREVRDNVESASPTQEIDLEDLGCIVEYGIDIGIGLSASALVPDLGSPCDALGDYIDDRITNLDESLDSPISDDSFGIGAGIDTSTSEYDNAMDNFIDDVNDRAEEASEQRWEVERGGEFPIPGGRR